VACQLLPWARVPLGSFDLGVPVAGEIELTQVGVASEKTADDFRMHADRKPTSAWVRSFLVGALSKAHEHVPHQLEFLQHLRVPTAIGPRRVVAP
jgi:hypothetical protein